MDKTKLISLVRRGDEKAVDELYFRTYQQPYTVVLAVVNIDSDAYEIMQNAYREAFSRFDMLSDYSGFRKGVNKLALFMCAVSLRKDGSSPFSGDYEFTADYIDVLGGAFKPENGADYTQQRQTVSRMIESLAPEERLVLLARCVLGLGVGEIAYSFGVSENTVTGCLNEAALRIKAQAERRLIGPALPAENLFSFIAWSFGKSAAESPVHEMSKEVREVALNISSQTEEPEPQTIARPAEYEEQTVKYEEQAVYSVADEQKFSQEYVTEMYSGWSEPVPEKPAPKRKKHIVRNIVIITVSVLFLAAGAFAFIAFALPQITGEPNPISKMITGKDAENTPEELVEQFETAFNKNDRDGMAKLFLPDQSLQRNLEGGAFQLINGLLGLFNSGDTPQIECDLKDLKKDGETAEGKVVISAEFPIVGKQSITLKASFEIKDNRWYFKELNA